MKVYFSPYTLTPVKRANRLSSLDQKHGVLLKGVLGDKVTFADYYPHIPLGDRPVDHFLQEFKFQNVEYDKKVFDFLLKDHGFQNIKPKRFMNHQLWTGAEPLEASVVKYKMLHAQDTSWKIPLDKGLRLRLDGNAIFTRKDYEAFVKDIPEKFHAQIDYLEDPLSEKDWSNLKLASARDFIEGTPFQYYIYKPNCEFKPQTDAKIIFSAYLGHSFGNWHTYCEMIESADLSLTQGIIGTGFYQEEKRLFDGSYHSGFMPDEKVVQKMYRDIAGLEWKSLCSM
jgi:hypothetical protein